MSSCTQTKIAPPRVAVITRTQNRPQLLPRAIESVLKQSISDWVHVIVNDAGPKDVVENCVAPYREQYGDRLQLIHREKSYGMEAASNAGIHASKSEWIIIHDDDDAWEPTFLESCLNFYEKHKSDESLAGIATRTMLVEERIVNNKPVEIDRYVANPELRTCTLFEICAHQTFVPIAFLYKRNACEEIGFYREDLPVLGDWDFNLRFVTHFDIAIIPKPLALWYHRIDQKFKRQDALGNSVLTQDEDFAYHQSRILNRLLREDLAAGKLGVGALMNIAMDTQRIQHNTKMVGRAFDKLLEKKWIRNILHRIGLLRTPR